MKLFCGLGKVLTLGFWAVVLASQAMTLPVPFELLFKLAGGFLILVHVLELVFFNASLRRRAHPWSDRFKILIFGIFHLQSFGRRQAEVHHA